jgi:hypothetical protein
VIDRADIGDGLPLDRILLTEHDLQDLSVALDWIGEQIEAKPAPFNETAIARYIVSGLRRRRPGPGSLGAPRTYVQYVFLVTKSIASRIRIR